MHLSKISLALRQWGARDPDAVIEALFANSEVGAWYDPSDLTTLFQDRAGAAPVTADGQPVGLILDKSKGLVLGPELAVNGDFNSATGWSLVGASISGGNLTFSSSALNDYASNSGGISAENVLFEITFTITSIASGSVRPQAGGIVGTARTSAGTYSERLVSISGGTLAIVAVSANTTAVISDISLKVITGNHAVAPSDAARPLYKERINLVSYSENITAHFDVLTHVTITPNAVTAPDGTATADLMTEGTNLNTYFGVTRNTIVPTGEGSHTVSAWVKPNGRNYFILYAYGDYSSYFGKYFELIGSGAVLGDYYTAPTNATITAFPNGWYLCTMTVPISLADNGVWFDVYLSPDGLTDTYNGDGASGAYVWGIQIAKGAEFGPYQRVENDVYNTVGLPKWLQFDGVDDSLSTATINFTSTDKMSIFAGVRKNNDVAAIVAELSSSILNNGSYYLVTGTDAGGTGYSSMSKGTASANQDLASKAFTFNAPETAVLTVTHDIAGDLSTIRRNGAAGTNATADKGSGNFGNYPLYIGSRAGNSVFINGNIYSLIIRGALSTTDEITATETWVNGKTGAY